MGFNSHDHGSRRICSCCRSEAVGSTSWTLNTTMKTWSQQQNSCDNQNKSIIVNEGKSVPCNMRCMDSNVMCRWKDTIEIVCSSEPSQNEQHCNTHTYNYASWAYMQYTGAMSSVLYVLCIHMFVLCREWCVWCNGRIPIHSMKLSMRSIQFNHVTYHHITIMTGIILLSVVVYGFALSVSSLSPYI